jgi:hypothetical protein
MQTTVLYKISQCEMMWLQFHDQKVTLWFSINANDSVVFYIKKIVQETAVTFTCISVSLGNWLLLTRRKFFAKSSLSGLDVNWRRRDFYSFIRHLFLKENATSFSERIKGRIICFLKMTVIYSGVYSMSSGKLQDSRHQLCQISHSCICRRQCLHIIIIRADNALWQR